MHSRAPDPDERWEADPVDDVEGVVSPGSSSSVEDPVDEALADPSLAEEPGCDAEGELLVVWSAETLGSADDGVGSAAELEADAVVVASESVLSQDADVALSWLLNSAQDWSNRC